MKPIIVFVLMLCFSASLSAQGNSLPTTQGEMLTLINPDGFAHHYQSNGSTATHNLPLVDASQVGLGDVYQYASYITPPTHAPEGCYLGFFKGLAITVNGKSAYATLNGETGVFAVFKPKVGPKPEGWYEKTLGTAVIIIGYADVTKTSINAKPSSGKKSEVVPAAYSHTGAVLRTSAKVKAVRLVEQRKSSHGKATRLYPISALDKIPVVQAEVSVSNLWKKIPIGYFTVLTFDDDIDGKLLSITDVGKGIARVVRPLSLKEVQSKWLQEKLKDQGLMVKLEGLQSSFAVLNYGRPK